jgi:hypothetical protein
MANEIQKPQAEAPRSEPEILPPGAADPRDEDWTRARFEAAGFRRIEIRQASGWRLFVWALAGLALLLLLLLMFASALLIALPVAAALFAVSYVAVRLRRALRG